MKRIVSCMLTVCIIAMAFGMVLPISVSAAGAPITTGLVDFETGIPSYIVIPDGFNATATTVNVSDSLEAGEAQGNASGNVLKVIGTSADSGGVSTTINLAADMPGANGTSGIMTYEFDYNVTNANTMPYLEINGHDYQIAGLGTESLAYRIADGSISWRQSDFANGWNHVSITLNYATGKIYTNLNNSDNTTEGTFDTTKDSLNVVIRASASKTRMWYLDNFKATYESGESGGTDTPGNPDTSDDTTGVVDFETGIPSYIVIPDGFNAAATTVNVSDSLEAGEAQGNASGNVLKVIGTSADSGGVSTTINLAMAMPGANGTSGIMTYEFDYNVTNANTMPYLEINGHDYQIAGLGTESLAYRIADGSISWRQSDFVNGWNHVSITLNYATGKIYTNLNNSDNTTEGTFDTTKDSLNVVIRASASKTRMWYLDNFKATYESGESGGTDTPEVTPATTGLVDFNDSALPSYMSFNGGVTSFVNVSDSLEDGESQGSASGKVLKLSHSSSGAVSLRVNLQNVMTGASGTAGIMTYEFDYNTEGANPGFKINDNAYKISDLYGDSVNYLTSEGDPKVHLESSGVGARKGNHSADHIAGWNHIKFTLNYDTGKIYTQVNGGAVLEGTFDTTQSAVNTLHLRDTVSTTKVWYLDNFKAELKAASDDPAVLAKLESFKNSIKIPTARLSTSMIALPGDADGNIAITVENSSDTSVIANGAVTEIGVVSSKTCRSIVINNPETEKTVTFNIKLAIGETSVVKEGCSVNVVPKRAVEIYNAKISGGKLNSVTMKKNISSSAKVFAAAYKNDVLSNAVIFDAATKTEALNLPVGDGEVVKYFVWDSITGLKPLQTVVENAQKPTIHILADSIYAEEPVDLIEAEQAGIGLKLKDYFNTAKMPINNRAMCGWSAYDFADHVSSGDYRLNGVLNSIKAGDYVLVSFNHNDQKVMDIGAENAPVYSAYLTRFVNEIRAKGATPILVTAIPRLAFSGSFTGNNADHVRFITAMKSVATATACDIVDLNAWFTNEITTAGYNSAKNWFDTANSDTTHLSHAGAKKCADWLGAELVKLYPALAEFAK